MKDGNAGGTDDIRRHAPKPVLRPGGSLRAMADEVDRLVNAERAAAERPHQETPAPAEHVRQNGWSARLNASRRRGIGLRISRE